MPVTIDVEKALMLFYHKFYQLLLIAGANSHNVAISIA